MFHEEVERAETALWGERKSADAPNVRYHLWLASGEREHLAEAKRLLDYRVEHAPEECRESMLENVRLNREITQEWARVQGEEGAPPAS